jgi:hypothetical protein
MSNELGLLFLIVIGLLLPLIVGAFLALNDGSGKISGIEWGIIINDNVTWWLVIVVGLLVYYHDCLWYSSTITTCAKPIPKSA